MPFEYRDYEYFLVSTQLVLMMIGMGATLQVKDFLEIVREPRGLLVGFAAMFLGAPLLAIGLNHLFGLDAGPAMGLILVSIMPGGSVSNVFTFLGRGNVPLSIAMTALATVGSIVTVPLLLELLAFETLPADFQMPVDEILRDIGLFLLAPLAVGMIFCRTWPVQSLELSKWCVRGGLAVLALVVVGSLTSGRIDPTSLGWRVPIAIILFCVLSQQIAMLPFRLLRWPTPDRFAVGIEITIRNVNLALLLQVILFPSASPDAGNIHPLADGVLFVVLYYGAVSLVASVPPIFVHRRIARAARDKHVGRKECTT
ncbi:MAG: bile acid:sodium symporter [Planctomycetota bacterium]